MVLMKKFLKTFDLYTMCLFLSILGKKVIACRTIVHIEHAIIDKFQSTYMCGQSSELHYSVYIVI